MTRHTFTSESKGRLDKLLFEKIQTLSELSGYSRSQVKRWIELGEVSVNGVIAVKAGCAISPGDVVTFSVVQEDRGTLAPFHRDLTILYEDDELLVLDKPCGLTMHPGAGNKSETLVNVLVAHLSHDVMRELGRESSVRPGIVHRLDKDTSGVVVVAKSLRAQSALSAQFAARSVSRRYRALVFITPRAKRLLNVQESGSIDAPLGRHPSRRTLIAVLDGGRRAVTHWSVVERFPYGALLDLKLETGRTHQIRVHLAHIGSPVIGDRTYGSFTGLPHSLKLAADALGRQALHAYSLGFVHPISKQELHFESALPADFARVVDLFREWRPD